MGPGFRCLWKSTCLFWCSFDLSPTRASILVPKGTVCGCGTWSCVFLKRLFSTTLGTASRFSSITFERKRDTDTRPKASVEKK